ncbi:MAG: TolC family protein [Clostridiales bacterium]|nr:TolC family protein [Clostridiales bacterium]
MKKKKILAIMILGILLLNSLPSTAKAAPNKEQLYDDVIEFDEIAELVRLYNLTADSNQHNLSDLKEMVDKEEDGPSSPGGGQDETNTETPGSSMLELTKMLEDMKEIAEDESQDEATRNMANGVISSLENSIASMAAQEAMQGSLSGMGSGGSSLSTQEYATYKWQFKQVEDQIVMGAQGLFPAYYQIEYNLEQLEANRSLLETSQKMAELRSKLGMATALDVAEASESVISLNNTILSLTNQQNKLKQELCKMLGRDYNENITLGELPELDWTYIVGMNLEKNKVTGSKNNYALSIKQNEVNQIGPGSTTNSQVARNDFENEKQTYYSKLDQQYQTVQEKKAELETETRKLEIEKTKALSIEKKFELGMISKFEYQSQIQNYINQETTVKTAKSTLGDAVNSYRWMLNGL